MKGLPHEYYRRDPRLDEGDPLQEKPRSGGSAAVGYTLKHRRRYTEDEIHELFGAKPIADEFRWSAGDW